MRYVIEAWYQGKKRWSVTMTLYSLGDSNRLEEARQYVPDHWRSMIDKASVFPIVNKTNVFGVAGKVIFLCSRKKLVNMVG